MWINPTPGRISSPYGMRNLGGGARIHHGTDISAPAGTPVLAASSGTVSFSTATGTGGNEIWIQHDGGILTKYLHLTVRQADVRQVVSAGQQIGTVGSTGSSSTGHHLHLETHVGGSSTDPQPFMAARGVTLGTNTPAPVQEDDMIYLRITNGTRAGDVWEVGELTADKLSAQQFEDIKTTIVPRMKDATAAAVDRVAQRVAARRTHIWGRDKGAV